MRRVYHYKMRNGVVVEAISGADVIVVSVPRTYTGGWCVGEEHCLLPREDGGSEAESAVGWRGGSHGTDYDVVAKAPKPRAPRKAVAHG